MTIDINELRRKLQSDDLIDRIDIHANVKPVLTELLDRLEAAEKDNALKEKLIDRLALELNSTSLKHDALRAKIEEMENQEPYSYIYEYSAPMDGGVVWRHTPGYWNAQFPKSSKPLYLAPGAKGE